jgi:hypothetical protein
MRVLRIIIILLVIIGFPAMSWIYLKSGLKWRVSAQDATEKKSVLADFTLLGGDSIRMTPADLLGTYYVVGRPADDISIAHLVKIHEQFHARPDFHILMIVQDSLVSQPVDTIGTRTRCILGCEKLETLLFEDNYTAAIVDDSLYVRGRYDLTSLEQMRKMVEHLAVVLPIEKREKIELKRGDK